MNDYRFTGLFKEEFNNFILYKQSLGYYKNIEEKKIYEYYELCDYLNTYNLDTIMITEEMTVNYLKRFKHLSPSTIHHKECDMRQFAKFLKGQGYENIFVQYDCIAKMPRDYVPYVFSDIEIYKILKFVDNYNFERYTCPRFYFSTLFRILYCTGIRLGEALKLKSDDIDIQNRVITVFAGKGNVTRILPYKESLNEWIIKYISCLPEKYSEYIFSGENIISSKSRVERFFKKVVLPTLDITFIKNENHSRGPCIHSFRHTFACESLNQMISEGKDPYCALPYLSFYLGHTSIENTEIYLHLTVQRYDEIIGQNHYIYEEILGDNEDD